MNREIRFRGYNVKNARWLHGHYFVNRGGHYIVTDGIANPFLTHEDFTVRPDTVGQFTGLYDADGKEIYEGDIIKSTYNDIFHVIGYNENRGAFTATLINEYMNNTDGLKTECNAEQRWLCDTKKVAVGNIHDNQSLLEGGKP